MLPLIRKAAQRDQVALLEQAANRLRPSLRRAFLDAVAQIQDEAVIKRLTEYLEAGDIEGAADYLTTNLERILLGSGVAVGATIYIDQWRKAHAAGADAGLKALPTAKAKAATYDPLAPSSVIPVREYSAQMVKGITDASRAGIVTALEETNALGYGTAKQARAVRGMIGLTSNQARAVTNFRDQLEQQRNSPLDAEGNPRFMRPADGRRLSATERAMVRRQLREGYLTDEQIDKMVNRYYESLLNKRAADIATTESMRAASMGQHAAWQQAQEQGILEPDTKRKWVTARDERVRHAHGAIPGMNREGVGLNEPFTTPDGPLLMPRDPAGTARNTIRCRCSVVLVNP